jgi:hypothetical protein
MHICMDQVWGDGARVTGTGRRGRRVRRYNKESEIGLKGTDLGVWG